MITLKKLLQQENIHARDSLHCYINGFYRVGTTVSFKILRQDDLHLDDECRLYGEKIEFENTIFDIPCLWIKNSQEISFTNCIFMGEVRIGQEETEFPEIKSIYFDYCIFLGHLKISRIEKAGSVTLNSVNAKDVWLLGICSPELRISYSRIACPYVAECNINEFTALSNEFSYIDIEANKFDRVNFNYAQLNIKKQPAVPDKGFFDNIYKSFDEFSFAEEMDYDELSKKEVQSRRSSTFDFLAKHSTIGINKDAMGDLKYLQTLASQPSRPLRWIQIVMGGFVKPSRIVTLVFITIIVFAAVFSLPYFKFSVDDAVRSITLLEATYYSGVTFATIGYGDIYPLNLWARFFAVLEGLIGVLLMSSFLASLLRKYIE